MGDKKNAHSRAFTMSVIKLNKRIFQFKRITKKKRNKRLRFQSDIQW